jgi:hypothetical protein
MGETKMTKTTKFIGFAAVANNGKPVWVMNEGTLSDGTPAYKVQVGSFGGYHGWSGGARRDVSYAGQIGMIAKSKVTRGSGK